MNDVRAMHKMLADHFGFEEFTILVDTDPSGEQPTGANIKVCCVLTIVYKNLWRGLWF